jgi:hypothetical protein
VYARRVDFAALVLSLSSHRHSYIGLVLTLAFSIHNKQQGNHLQTCQVKSVTSQTHDWVVYHLGDILGSVGHRVKIYKITTVTGKERGEFEIKVYVVLQKPQEQTDRLPPPRTLILDFTLTHTCYGSSHVHTTGQLTNTRRSAESSFWLSC